MRTTIIDNDFGHLEYELVQGQPFLHLSIKQWSKELYNAYLQEWHRIKKWFKERGYTTLWAAIPSNDEKLKKFEEMFGFSVVFEQDNHFLMKQEI